MILSLFILGVDADTTHTSREQHLVGVADQASEVEVVGLLHGGVMGVLAPRLPVVAAPDEVVPEDHAGPVVLETLSGIDAADLTEPAFVAGPEMRGGRIRD